MVRRRRAYFVLSVHFSTLYGSFWYFAWGCFTIFYFVPPAPGNRKLEIKEGRVISSVRGVRLEWGKPHRRANATLSKGPAMSRATRQAHSRDTWYVQGARDTRPIPLACLPAPVRRHRISEKRMAGLQASNPVLRRMTRRGLSAIVAPATLFPALVPTGAS